MTKPTGDPEGRRLQRRRHLVLAEAGRLARALQVLLRLAGLDERAGKELAHDIASHEIAALPKGMGRIEGRQRFKGQSGTPLHEGRGRNSIFIDESGKSAPRVPGDPFFALGGVALGDAAQVAYHEAADAVKMDFFERTDITFHEPLMRQRKGPYYFDGNGDRQREFDGALARLVHETDLMAFGVVIRKEAFADEFAATGIDPYLPTDVYSLAIQLLMERYVDYLATNPARPIGRVMFESQGPLEDALHQREFVETLIGGTQWVAGAAFRNCLETGVMFCKKDGSHPMELADMFSRDLFEWVRDGCVTEPGRWRLFGPKMHRRGDRERGKFGVKVFPDSDIRDTVMAHRKSLP